MRRSVILLAIAIGCTESGVINPVDSVPDTTPIPFSVSVTPASGASIAVGASTTFQATVLDALDQPMSGRAVVWGSSDTRIATVDEAGKVTGVSPGTVAITAAVKGQEGIRKSVDVTVLAPPRVPGSIFRLGLDSVFQNGAWLYVSTLVSADTSRTGTDVKFGVLRTAGSVFVPPVSRLGFPRLVAIAECPNQDIYAIDTDEQLWKVTSQTATVTLIGSVSLTSISAIAGMSCDATNALLIAGNFAGFGSLYRVSPVTLSATVINSVINQTYLGVGASPAGIVYVTIRDPNNGTNRHLSTVNTNSGALTDVGTLPQATFELVFRGSRLLGVTFSGGNDVLVEASVANASLTTIRTLRLP